MNEAAQAARRKKGWGGGAEVGNKRGPMMMVYGMNALRKAEVAGKKGSITNCEKGQGSGGEECPTGVWGGGGGGFL